MDTKIGDLLSNFKKFRDEDKNDEKKLKQEIADRLTKRKSSFDEDEVYCFSSSDNSESPKKDK